MTDQYGNFRTFKPFSRILKEVSQGDATNKTSRMQKVKRDFQPPGVINRGDRSGTIWARRKKMLTDNVIASNAIDDENDTFSDPFEEEVLDQVLEEVADDLIDGIEDGFLTEEEAERIFQETEEIAELMYQPSVISTYTPPE